MAQGARKAVIKFSKPILGLLGKKQYYFVLHGDNGEPISTSEMYTQKHNTIEVLKKYFSEFKIIDKTREN
jgi:uncharacterized protein YegP (UPF0339 family)